MKLFPFANKQKREYAPEETPLGPRSYPHVGGKPTVLGILSQRRWWFIGIGLAIILVIVFVVLLVQRSGNGGLTSQIRLSIDGPEQVTLGSDVSYTVSFANDSGDTLDNVRLLTIYPEGFSFTSADPAPDNPPGTEFSFGQVAKGEGRDVLINGRLVGAVRSEQIMIARLQFSPDGGSDILQVEATFTTKIETAGFAFDVEAPETALPNNKVTLEASLENNEDAPLTSLQLRVTYPSGFDFTSADPLPDAEERIWNIASLGINEKSSFLIEGVLGGAAGELKRFSFEAGVLDQDGKFLKQAEVEKAVKLSLPAVTVTQTVNTQQGDIAVDGRSSLKYEVTFENTGATGLSNLVLEVPFEGEVWDPSTLVVKDGGAVEQGNVIRWDGTSVPELRTLGARQKAEVGFEVRPYFEPVVEDGSDKQLSTTSTPLIRIGSAVSEGNPITAKYRAGITVGATASVASGANPPEVNQETIYEVTWTLTNLYNDLSGARLVGSVPPGSEFVTGSGSVTAGEELTYNQNSNQILWNIGRVPANVGKLSPVVSATFRVRIIPPLNERGIKKTLTNNQSFSAQDTWTAEEREEPIPEVQSAKII